MSFFYIFHDRLPTILRYCHKFGEVSNKTTTTCNIFMYIICLWTMVDVILPLGSSWCYVVNAFGGFHDEFTALQKAIALLEKMYLKTVNPNWEINIVASRGVNSKYLRYCFLKGVLTC